jgi:hypothetical protein
VELYYDLSLRLNAPFQERYQELKMYKEKYKNVNVPARWKENPQLATWVSIQRTKKKQGRLKFERYVAGTFASTASLTCQDCAAE